MNPVFVHAAEPTVDPEDLPRIPATPPEKAHETFEIKDGFRIDLVAAEPLLVDPVAVAFDENGRMFVIEMVDYSERRDERLGQVKVLEDTDGDGRFDESRVYADDLAWPTAVICYDGGIFVASSPDILWFKDTNGDGKADERKTIFTGFGSHAKRLNVQALLNNLTWGLDNRIHGATSRNGGLIQSVVHPNDPPVELRSRDFSFDPRTLKIRAEAGGGQHGMSFDNRGRKFVCSNSHHLQSLMYEERYAGRNSHYTMPRNLIDIAVDGPAAEVYRISPDEPWRITRTKWRVDGLVPGPVEGGGRVSGYFTGATGATVYRGNALPSSFLNNVFIGDAGGNLVHRKLVRTEGVEPVAERPEDEQTVEFLASTDNWFRPVDFANAPDGALYILDMYREVIEHPWSIPESIKQYLDLNSGNDRGRIYRVVPEDFEQPAPVRLAEMSPARLVATLGHPNGWHRDTAARLLYERQDRRAVPHLENFARNASSALGRMHALYALAGLGALKPGHVTEALADPDERVRQHAVRCAEAFADDSGPAAEALADQLTSLSGDPSPLVRYQLAFTLGEMAHPDRIRALAEIVERDIDDKWISAAVLSSLADGAGELFAVISADSALSARPEIRRFLGELIGMIAARNEPEEVAKVADFLAELPPEISFGLVEAFGAGLLQAGSSLTEADPSGALRSVIAQAAQVAENRTAAAEKRLAAIRLLGLSDYGASGPALLNLFALNETQAVQLAALGALDRFDDPAVGAELLERWETFTPRLRSEVLTLLLKRPERSIALLKAVRSGVVQVADISSTQADFLKKNRNEAVRALAAEVLKNQQNESRAAALEKFKPALQLSGDAERGKARYQMLCASCHRAGDSGHALGPDVATLKAAGKESLLVNIVDPNREVAPSYLTYLVETNDGKSHLGLIVNETPQSVTLRQAFGMEQVVPRSNIVRIRSQGHSMMPQGLEGALDPQGMADLLEFIAGEEM